MLSLRPIEHCDGAVMELRRCIEFDVNAMFYKLAISISMSAIVNGRLGCIILSVMLVIICWISPWRILGLVIKGMNT